MANDNGMHNKSVLETWSSTKHKETPHYPPTDLDKIAAMTPTFAHFCQWFMDFDPRYANHFSAGSLMQETGLRNLAISIEAASTYSAVPTLVKSRRITASPPYFTGFTRHLCLSKGPETNEQGVSFTFRGPIQLRVS